MLLENIPKAINIRTAALPKITCLQDSVTKWVVSGLVGISRASKIKPSKPDWWRRTVVRICSDEASTPRCGVKTN